MKSSLLPFAFVWAPYICMGKMLRISKDFSSGLWANVAQISCRASLGQGNDILLKWCGSLTKLATCPYMVKTFKNLLQNCGCLWAESLHKLSGTGSLPKSLKWFSYIDVWLFYREVKFSSICICMGPINLYGKNVGNFKWLLLWSLWVSVAQISCGACLEQGNLRWLKWSWFIDQDGCHAIW